MNFSCILKKSIYLLCILLLILLIYLSFYAQPLKDELLFINERKLGFVKAFLNIYYTWMSRYTGMIIMLTSTLNYTVKLYFIYPIVSILIVFFSIYYFIKEIASNNILLYSCVIFNLLVFFLPSISDFYYWLASTSIYTIPTCFILFYIIALKKKNILMAIIFQIVILGGIEINIPIIFAIVMYYMFTEKNKKKSTILLLFFLMNVGFIIFNEGNQTRQQLIVYNYKEVPSLLKITLLSVRKSITFIIKYNLLCFLFLLLINYIIPIKLKYKKVHIKKVFFFYIYAIFTTIFVGTYGIKNNVPLRIENITFFISIFNLFLIANYFTSNFPINYNLKKISFLTIILAYLFIPNFTYSQSKNNFLTIVNELYSGNFNEIKKENNIRLSIVQNNKGKDCVVPIKKYSSKIVTVDDSVDNDEESYGNQIYANYFNLKSIKTKKN